VPQEKLNSLLEDIGLMTRRPSSSSVTPSSSSSSSSSSKTTTTTTTTTNNTFETASSSSSSSSIDETQAENDNAAADDDDAHGGLGMDCSIVRTRHKGLFQVSTTDFFFPLVEDPYEQGWIACANVLSDLFALGLADADNLLMLLGASVRMAEPERDIVTRHLIRGFDDCARAAGTRVTGGQTTLNEWPLIGGVAMTCAVASEFIRPELGVPGDRIVLTKALGTQVAVNIREWLQTGSFERRLTLPAAAEESAAANTSPAAARTVLSPEAGNAAYVKARRGMCRLNRTAARLMHRYGAHGATDVTGFGVRGHCANLAANQKQPVDLVLHSLPVIAGMCAVDDHLKGMFRLRAGYSAETSGGLLVLLPSQEAAEAYCRELEAEDGEPAWIIGEVVAGSGEAVLADDLVVIEI